MLVAVLTYVGYGRPHSLWISSRFLEALEDWKVSPCDRKRGTKGNRQSSVLKRKPLILLLSLIFSLGIWVYIKVLKNDNNLDAVRWNHSTRKVRTRVLLQRNQRMKHLYLLHGQESCSSQVKWCFPRWVMSELACAGGPVKSQKPCPFCSQHHMVSKLCLSLPGKTMFFRTHVVFCHRHVVHACLVHRSPLPPKKCKPWSRVWLSPSVSMASSLVLAPLFPWRAVLF